MSEGWPEGDVEFVDAVGSGPEEELDTGPARRPWWAVVVLAVLVALVGAALVRSQHSSDATPSAHAAPKHAGPVIPSFGRLSAASDPDSSTADDGGTGIEFPVPARNPTATATVGLDPQLPILLGPEQCRVCSSDDRTVAAVHAAVRAQFPGLYVVSTTSVIDRARGMRRPLVTRSVLAVAGARTLFVLLQRQQSAPPVVHRTSADGRVRTVAVRDGHFLVQVSVQGLAGHLPRYARLRRLAHDPRLVAKR